MRIKDGNILLKILYWGPAASGKTTCLGTLRKLTQAQNLEVKPTGDLKEISMASGATLYFDHGIFQSVQDPRVFYHTYTVAGQNQFEVLRKKVLQGTDGIILVFDSNSPRWDDCVDSVKELRNVVGEDIVKKMPLVVLLNKADLPCIITINQVKDLLRQVNLWSDVPGQMEKNPNIYETIALFEKKINIYESFYDVARRAIDQVVEIVPKQG